MATKDLGEIRTTPTPGSPEPGAIDVLSSAAAVVQETGEAVQDGILSGTRNLLDKTVDAEFDALDTGQQEELGPLPTHEVASGEDLLLRVEKLRARANQSTGSRAANARLRLRQETARLQRKYPGLADEFSTQLRSFESTDPELFYLNIVDSTAKDAADFAATQLKELEDESYASVSEGGLGLSRVFHPFGSKQWADRAVVNASYQLQAQNAEVVLQAKQAQGSLNAMDKAEAVKPLIAGVFDVGYQNMLPFRDDLVSLSHALVNPTDPNSQVVISSWESGNKQSDLLNRAEIAIAQMQSVLVNTFTPTEMNTEEYRSLEGWVNTRVSSIQRLVDSFQIQDVNERAKAINAFNTLEANWKLSWVRENGQFHNNYKNIEMVLPVLDFMTDAGWLKQGAPVANDLANWINADFSDYAASVMGATPSQEHRGDPVATRREMEDKQNQSQDPAGNGYGRNNPRAHVAQRYVNAVGQYANRVVPGFKKEGPQAWTPESVYPFVSKMGMDVGQQLTDPHAADDARYQTLLGISSEDSLATVAHAAQFDPGVMAPYMDDIETYWVGTRKERTDSLIGQLVKESNQVSIAPYITLEYNERQQSISVDFNEEDYMSAVLQNPDNVAVDPLSPVGQNRLRENARTNARAIVDKFTRMLAEHVSITAMINGMRSGTYKWDQEKALESVFGDDVLESLKD
jgi:hypothetical protein